MAAVLLTGLFAVQVAALVVEHAVVLPKVHMVALDAMIRLGVQQQLSSSSHLRRYP